MSSDKEQPEKKKGKGSYLEVYDEEAYALFNASGEHDELVLRRAVAAYLCRNQEPDFSEEGNAADLWRAWYHIERYLMRGKYLNEIRREAGERGGAPKGNQNARKHPPSTNE